MKGLAQIVIFQRCQDLLLNLDRMASFMSSLQVSYEQLLFFFFFFNGTLPKIPSPGFQLSFLCSQENSTSSVL